jgi:uncharacterized protein (DUF2267 family)
MPMPHKYAHASEDFDRFLVSALECSGLTTRNQAYTMTQGVLQTFRRRLNLEAGVIFAGALPPVLAAIFIADWDMGVPAISFADRIAMTREVQGLRADHNFSPDTCIHDVAVALRRSIGDDVLDSVLELMPQGAKEFWAVS